METAVRSTSIGLACGTRLQEIHHGGGNRPVGDQVLLQLLQFRPLRQPSVPQQEDDFFESGMVGQRVNVVAAVAEEPAYPSM